MANKFMNIVIPMAGLGSRFQAKGFKTPKPFIKVGDKRMIEWVVDNIRPSTPHRFIFIANKAHLDNFNGRDLLLAAGGKNTKIIELNEVTDGAARTCLLAKNDINNDNGLIIANSDQFIDNDVQDFYNQLEENPCIMTMRAVEDKWSFVRVENDLVTEVVEKVPISTQATVGIYYWNKGKYFVESAEEMIQKDIRHNKEFYVAPTFNQLIQKRIPIKTYDIPRVDMLGMGTPEDLEIFRLVKSVKIDKEG